MNKERWEARGDYLYKVGADRPLIASFNSDVNDIIVSDHNILIDLKASVAAIVSEMDAIEDAAEIKDNFFHWKNRLQALLGG